MPLVLLNFRKLRIFMNFCILLKRVLAKSELYEHIVLAASIAIVAKRSLKIIKLIGYLLVKKKKKKSVNLY